jgi:hypothetical protein
LRVAFLRVAFFAVFFRVVFLAAMIHLLSLGNIADPAAHARGSMPSDVADGPTGLIATRNML